MKTIKNICTSLIVIGFLCTTSIGVAQVDAKTQAKVEQMAKQMFIDVNNKDYDAILEMSHPKMFDLVPKEQIKEVFKSSFEGNEDYSIEIPKVIPEYEVSEVIENKEESYAFVVYDMKMKMTFHKQTFDDQAKKGMKSMMEMQGMEVEFISDNAVEMVMKDRITILIKDDNTNQRWAMINYDPKVPFYTQVLSANVLEAAKKYNEDLKIRRKKEEEKKN